MSEDGRFFRHAAQGTPVSCNSRYATPQCIAEAERFELSEPFCEARPLSRGLVSTAHPYFLLFDTAKLGRPDAAYLRSGEKSQKYFIALVNLRIVVSENFIKFASDSNLIE